MVNRNRSNWSAMGSSMFEFECNLDERQKEREVIYTEFKQRLIQDYKATVKEFAERSNAVKIDTLIEEGIRILHREFL